MSHAPRTSQVRRLVAALVDEYEAAEAVDRAADPAARAAAKSALARARAVTKRIHDNTTPAEGAEAMRIIKDR